MLNVGHAWIRRDGCENKAKPGRQLDRSAGGSIPRGTCLDSRLNGRSCTALTKAGVSWSGRDGDLDSSAFTNGAVRTRRAGFVTKWVTRWARRDGHWLHHCGGLRRCTTSAQPTGCVGGFTPAKTRPAPDSG